MATHQTETGQLTESRVKSKLESFGLIVWKPVPDVGIDLEAFHPSNPGKIIKIQVKGRNPKTITSYRWFQIRVPKLEILRSKQEGILAEDTWQEKVKMVDFYILDAVHFDEMWVLSQEQTFELIKLNEYQYGTRPDNVFVYSENMKQKQKEMNLEAKVPGVPIIERFASCKNNFNPILDFLGVRSD